MSLAYALDRLSVSPEFARCSETLLRGETPVWIEGLAGTSKVAVIAALIRRTGRPACFITSSEEHAERLVSDLLAFGFGPDEALLYPSTEADLRERPVAGVVAASSTEHERRAVSRARLAVLDALAGKTVRFVAAPLYAALRETVPAGLALQIEAGATLEIRGLGARLVELGYERTPLVTSAGQFAVRGGLVDVWPSTADQPCRIEFFDDLVESLRPFDAESQLSGDSRLDRLRLLPAAEDGQPAESEFSASTLLSHLPAGAIIVLDEPNHLRSHWEDLKELIDRMRRQAPVEGEGRGAGAGTLITLETLAERLAGFRVAVLTLLSHSIPWLRKLSENADRVVMNSGVLDLARGDAAALVAGLRSLIAAGNQVFVASDQPHRVAEILTEQSLPSTAEEGPARRPGEEAAAETTGPDPVSDPRVVRVVHGRLSSGFRLTGARLVVLGDHEIFGRGPERARPRDSHYSRRFKEGRPIFSLLELAPGDLVVHVTHGIGRYRGLVTRKLNGLNAEFLQIDYQEPDRLFVPSDQLDRVQKYVGCDGQAPTIHRLGSGEWQRQKTRVRARVQEMARELIELYARRQAARGYACSPDTVWQQEMEAAFPYRETSDQLAAIADTKRDQEKPQPMDRLVCGDVGYGKTEVAVRAAFKAVTDGKQVAVLVPTTVLAQQHFNTFTERMAAFPIRIELLSRFRSRLEIKKSLEGLRDGTVDIAIGTHRLLSKDVEFHDLGLLIVDEEQRFGVAHKERLKQLKASVDVLTLTATPIPRTLHMSLGGLRDMSVIEEPPEGRLAVRTYCMESDPEVIREAVLRELDRGGQVYYVHNRVESIYREADRLHRLVPQARIRVGHGQMKDSELEDVMLSFYQGDFDVLVCTTIIESGLDIPNVNTIILDEADHLGLAQLHQLRGRVGRSSLQSYCYLLYKPCKELSEIAERRLQALREFTDLGAGFKIAMRDMELRGAGNLLGAEQHGSLVTVGFDMYCQMIEAAVRELRGEEPEEELLPGVTLRIPALIPPDYIPTDALRIAFYKKIAACRTHDHVAQVQRELEDRFGDPPKSVWNLLAIMRLRIDCILAGVGRVESDREAVVLWMARKLLPEEARELYRSNKRAQFLPDRVLLYVDDSNPLRPVEEMIGQLKKRAGKSAVTAVRKALAAANAAEVVARPTARG